MEDVYIPDLDSLPKMQNREFFDKISDYLSSKQSDKLSKVINNWKNGKMDAYELFDRFISFFGLEQVFSLL